MFTFDVFEIYDFDTKMLHARAALTFQLDGGLKNIGSSCAMLVVGPEVDITLDLFRNCSWCVCGGVSPLSLVF